MIRKLKIILEMIKFEHTVFALPFAFMGTIVGSIIINGRFPEWMDWVWIVVAMFGARSAAMSLNRLIDERIDRDNPRTADRAIPSGLVSKMEVLLFIVVSFALLFIAAFQLNPLAVVFLPLAVFLLVIYSYTKRFTWMCHIVLGLTIGFAPLGGWIAVTGQITWTAIILYLAVALWIAGFDVVYATQDAEYDRERGLYSIPSRFGVAKGLMIARGLHIASFCAFLMLFFITGLLGWIYLIGVIIAGLMMLYQHSLVTKNDLSRVMFAFFPMNGTLSVVMFCFTMGDILL
ncbi:UbiA-like polyprenyltransferase [Alkalicoccobacillus porphyridii]|uniref:4-hydroxybenzoate polyprenyltransferase n=1 Tax=Alkalicoccobacillus porphyridii TaxID=2597270 RepID=A0A553ZZN7_9BACI|nr:UbiA-like polyprenyltransferase [Alkalicoccobacillus porphyridii]TSB46908.1 4-hydroxybenzoate octaprenyltransferase [Alkalicoccobacillus porphyridii]